MADKLITSVGLAPVAIRVPSGNLENQVITNPGPGTLFLGGAGVTPASGLPFPPGSKAELIRNGSSVFACVNGSIPVTGAPALPATGVAATNNTGQPVAVTVAGGTVTVIAVGGVTQSANGANLTSGTFVVPAGGTITITYSVAPSFVWQYGSVTSAQISPGVQAS